MMDHWASSTRPSKRKRFPWGSARSTIGGALDQAARFSLTCSRKRSSRSRRSCRRYMSIHVRTASQPILPAGTSHLVWEGLVSQLPSGNAGSRTNEDRLYGAGLVDCIWFCGWFVPGTACERCSQSWSISLSWVIPTITAIPTAEDLAPPEEHGDLLCYLSRCKVPANEPATQVAREFLNWLVTHRAVLRFSRSARYCRRCQHVSHKLARNAPSPRSAATRSNGPLVPQSSHPVKSSQWFLSTTGTPHQDNHVGRYARQGPRILVARGRQGGIYDRAVHARAPGAGVVS